MKLQPITIVLFLLVSACNKTEKENYISFTNKEIKIDGESNDLGWQNTNWKKINQNWLGSDYSEEDFKGRYKLAWNHNHLYVLAEIIDDILIDNSKDGLVKYWDDDCLEIFIDEDASGGDHQYNYNAFAYHVGLDNRVVDIGPDSLPHYYDHIKCFRKTIGNKSIWELSIDIYDDNFQLQNNNTKVKLEAKKEIGFAIAYCDNDKSEERENFIGSIEVKGEDKNRGWIDAGVFEKIILSE